jgi:hypothetical protein
MAIVQISKIQHRTGANTDLPQLDIGEIGFSTDTQQVFIGNDPVLVPIDTNVSFTTQTEILSEVSLINSRIPNGPGETKIFAPLAGGGNTVFNIQNIRTGQLIVGDGDGVAANTLVNWTGNRLGNAANVATNKLKLGGVANIIITGGSSGSVLSTDGTGNLSWESVAGGGAGGSVADQTGASGKFLTTNGTITSWSNVFTDSNFANTVKSTISVTDSGGDGNLSYANGVITYNGPNATEVRAHFSAGTGVTYAANGQISIGQSVANTANVEFDGITGSNLILLSTSANAVLYTSTTGNVVSSESDFTYNSTTNTLNVGVLVTTGAIEVGSLFKSAITTQTGTSTGTPGQICWDADYIYVCTSTNVWKRVLLSTF